MKKTSFTSKKYYPKSTSAVIEYLEVGGVQYVPVDKVREIFESKPQQSKLPEEYQLPHFSPGEIVFKINQIIRYLKDKE